MKRNGSAVDDEGEEMKKEQPPVPPAGGLQGKQDEEEAVPEEEGGRLEEVIRENKELQEQLAAMVQENSQLRDRMLRLQAESENFRKRMTREKEEFVRYAKEEFIREILPIKDNLERALDHGGEVANPEAVIDGVTMILDQFSSIFEKMGVTCLSCCGEPFDPNFHEAMMHQETAELEPNTVMVEHQKGYVYQGRLLRPSLVTVAKAVPKEDEQDDG
ncbi:MAG: nucleotide exchange factor GrpE [Deltaproteobacteria bacterium]|nr:nucleotide exchange factor GrpE [Candidatus Anaeroferrophillus wilburensis]MBN2888853.1 nucleotide exchange factor GrpE [Deltaproteobacteria bacterium]